MYGVWETSARVPTLGQVGTPCLREKSGYYQDNSNFSPIGKSNAPCAAQREIWSRVAAYTIRSERARDVRTGYGRMDGKSLVMCNE
jgi:hypothetical protein